MKKSIKEISKSSSIALGAIYMKYINSCEIDSVLNKACRMYVGVSKNASNIVCRGDMGWLSCEVKQKLNGVRLWCRLRNLPNNRLVKEMYKYSLYRGKSWESKSKKLFEILRIDKLLLVDSPCKAQCTRKAKEKLMNTDRETWYNSLMSDGKDTNNRNKLRTYRLYKSIFQAESYVKFRYGIWLYQFLIIAYLFTFNMSRDQRQIRSKFRSCTLPLAIETDRFTKLKTPLKGRIFKFCSASSVEDETHFLIECEFYNDVRYDLFESVSKLNDNFGHFNPEEKLSQIPYSSILSIACLRCLEENMPTFS